VIGPIEKKAPQAEPTSHALDQVADFLGMKPNDTAVFEVRPLGADQNPLAAIHVIASTNASDPSLTDDEQDAKWLSESSPRGEYRVPPDGTHSNVEIHVPEVPFGLSYWVTFFEYAS
jgi:hypothetical protein